MATGAELSLQIVRRAQSFARPDVPQAPDLWLLWPGGERLDWVRARARLGALGKPLLVAPLLEPGMLGIWPIDTLDEERKRAVGRESPIRCSTTRRSSLRSASRPDRSGSHPAHRRMK